MYGFIVADHRLAITGANRHDVTQIEELLDSVIIERPDIFAKPQHVCLDNGYAGESALEIIVLRGFIPHIRGRRQEETEREIDPDKKPRRWVVEVCHSWMNRFKKLLVRYEKSDLAFTGLVMFVCTFLAFRKCEVI